MYGCITGGCAANGTLVGSDNAPGHPGGLTFVFGQDGLFFGSGRRGGEDASHIYFDPKLADPVSGISGHVALIAAVCFVQSEICGNLPELPVGDPIANIEGFGEPIRGFPVGVPVLHTSDDTGLFEMSFYNSIDPKIQHWYGVHADLWFGTLNYRDGIATIVDSPVPEPSSLLLLATAILPIAVRRVSRKRSRPFPLSAA